MEKEAGELFEEFKELTASEFFRRNRQMLGFSGKIRSLTMICHELITNSLDAAEEAGILPEITVNLKKIGKDHYTIEATDNGPGIPEDYITKVFCTMFAGSKFRNIQSRGQQGIGCSGCVLFSQMTTGKPAKIISKYKEEDTIKGVEMTFKMDVKKNQGLVLQKNDINASSTGVSIKLHLKDVSYSLSEQGAYEYIRRTIIANPHAKIIFEDPNGERIVFDRATDKIPPLPKEVLPHPKGVTADDLIFMAKHTDKRRIRSFLINSFSRMSTKKVAEIEKLSGIDLNKRPKDMKWEEAEKLVETFDLMEFMAPPTDGLIPIGQKQIEKGIREILNPEFSIAITRRPKTYRGGISFIIEIGIAYGGGAGRVVNEQKRAEIMRFANRVPLTFDQGSCAITDAIKSIDWKRYGIKDFENAPLTVFVNLISTNVPYMSAGKQSIAPEDEIIQEIRQATMNVARNLQKYLRAKKREKEEELRSMIFETYIPMILEEAAKLAEEEVPPYDTILEKITKRSRIRGESDNG